MMAIKKLKTQILLIFFMNKKFKCVGCSDFIHIRVGLKTSISYHRSIAYMPLLI